MESAEPPTPPQHRPPAAYEHLSPSPSRQRLLHANKLKVTNVCYKTDRRTADKAFLARFQRQVQNPKASNILKSVSFTAESSQILAVAGPSGAGKSTLLRLISGRLRSSRSEPGSISLNDQELSPTQLRKLCGYVTQDNNLLPLLTVEETLSFACKFLLRGCTAEERRERVDSLMEDLGLTSIAKSFVGDDDVRGISGGERKRVSIAVDMIHNPPVLLLDEPTSGLDSKSALQVIDLLSAMAKKKGQILILTIHQPSYTILQYLSSFLFLSQGSVAHLGDLSSLEEAIAGLGYRIPAQVNPVEFAMEILPKLEESYAEPWSRRESSFSSMERRSDSHGYCSRWEELGFLCWRFWKIMYRTKELFVARIMQAVVGGLGLGSVFFQLGNDPSGVAQRLGFFAFTLSFLLSSTVEALPIFLQERRVLMKETSRGMYRVSSYIVSNTLVFLLFLLVASLLFSAPVYWLVGLNHSPGAFLFFTFMVWLIFLTASSVVLFLGAVSPDFMLGNSLLCVFLGVFFLFSGYFIPKESIPWYWIYMYYVSIYRYPLDAMLINEYWGDRTKCFSWEEAGEGNQPNCSLNGGDVLRMRGLERDTRWINVLIMLGFILFYRVLSWVVLLRKTSKTML